MYWNKNGRMIPITMEEMDKAFNIKHSPMYSNIQYTLEYLDILNAEINSICTTDTVMKIYYKNYLINAMSVIESILLYVLKINNAMPQEEYKELCSLSMNERKFSGKYLKAKTIIFEKTYPFDKKIDFENMINRINDKNLMNFTHKKYLTIKNLKILRNKVHLFIADTYSTSDFNSFSRGEYIWSKYALYAILTDPSICIDSSYLNCFKLTTEELNYIKNNPLKVSYKEKKEEV